MDFSDQAPCHWFMAKPKELVRLGDQVGGVLAASNDINNHDCCKKLEVNLDATLVSTSIRTGGQGFSPCFYFLFFLSLNWHWPEMDLTVGLVGDEKMQRAIYSDRQMFNQSRIFFLSALFHQFPFKLSQMVQSHTPSGASGWSSNKHE